MNPHDPIQHLSHDELLIAAVDHADLDNERQAHLKTCAECRQALTHAKHRLTRLGRMATEMAPKPSRPFRLPEKSAPSVRWMFKPSWAMAFTVIMLLAITIWHPQWLTAPQKEEVAVIDLSDDRRLMEAVDALVSNALPVDYQQLAALSEPLTLDDADVDDDDDFLDWIVPPIEEEDHDDNVLS